MTAEVIILNSNGIALAADSAVTIGGQKIYNSAIKLFALSKTEPVGIMVYGNASLMDVPWETLIKIYRNNLKSEQYPTLEEYGDNFLNYLREKHEFFPEETQKQWVRSNVGGYYIFLRKSLFDKIHPVLQEKGEITDEETATIFESIILKEHKKLSDLAFIGSIDKEFESGVRKKYLSIFKDAIDEIFQNLKPRKAFLTKIYDIGAMLQTREIFSQSTSGIVISGYGAKEIYPSVLSYEIEGFIDGKLKFRVLKDKSSKIKHGTDCAIIPFAQDDMVSLFMNGANPAILGLVETYLKQLFNRIPELISDDDLSGSNKKSIDIKDDLKKHANSLLIDFFSKLREHIQGSHIDPVMNMVRVLPKDELASMAEALVNLTAFKRRMTNTIETVGGPVDVAVISKGDGLVWVKRKHYFPGELNQHFFQNYFRGISNGV
jgi:hypothetical protein